MRHLISLLVLLLVCPGCETLPYAEAGGADQGSVRSPARGAGVQVNRKAAQVAHRTFDPNKAPTDMPPLGSNEAAVTHSAYGVGAQVQVVVVNESKSASGQVVSEMRIESVKVDTTLAITVWLPKNASKSLVAHEEGHRRISEMFYEDAESIAREVAQPYVGRTIRATARSVEAAREAAMTKAIGEVNGAYMARTQIPSSRVNELFDRITDHGRNTRVSVHNGIRRALEQYRKESR
jgi:hypothetical protein